MKPGVGDDSDLPERSPPRFFADAMLGTLARRLRMLGFDTLYRADIEDADLVQQARTEARTILTRDRRLVERRLARPYLLIESDQVDRQLRQVLAELDLRRWPIQPFGRCLACNTLLERLTSVEARSRVPPFVARTQRRYRHCPTCDRLFWRATHVEAMERKLVELGISPPRSDSPRPKRG